ncbi:MULTISPECIES: hypothetical protein [Pseudomonas]|jgi:hypothetical protein|uniref:hypothetical protein n=1 Tax=Pseudomonas TaxID=286 RepID=UPI0011149984|nr:MULTISPECIES: hypothetical protein [Pseudomonas]
MNTLRQAHQRQDARGSQLEKGNNHVAQTEPTYRPDAVPTTGRMHEIPRRPANPRDGQNRNRDACDFLIAAFFFFQRTTISP